MIILGTNSIKDTGYDVANSCRFNSAGDDKMDRTIESPTLGTKFTFSTWIKKDLNGDYHHILTSSANPGNFDIIRFDNSDNLQVIFQGGGDTLTTNRKFRDVAAFYNIVVAVDTTQGTAANRVKIYINGTQETSFSTETYPDQNLVVNYQVSGKTLRIGANTWDTSTGHEKLGGVICETVFIDGVAHAPTDFGEFDEDSGIWKPIDVSGLTFGNNGFYLDYQDSSALGNDVSGNNNDFSTSGLAAIDQSTDTCTNNFATLNPLYPTGGGFDNQSGASFEEGNTKFTTDNGDADWGTCVSTIAVSSGKWYVEMKKISGSEGVIGIRANNSDNDNAYIGRLTHGVCYQQSGHKRVASTQSTYGDTWTTNDIIGVALDLDNNKLYFSKNGTWQNSGDPTSGATGTGAISIDAASSTVLGVYYIGATEINSSGNGTFNFNFGNPSFSISSGNTDGNGYGNFEYAPPSGYYALNTKNLAEYG